MKKPTHCHKLRKHKYKTGNKVYFCILPDCHYKIDAALSLGKRTLCNICNEEFLMSEYTIKLDKPHCENCGKVKVKDADGATRYVKKITNKVLSNVAVDIAENLRSRLDNTVNPVVEDDI